jgi:predicted secreted protein
VRGWLGALAVGASLALALAAMQASSGGASAQPFEPSCPAQSNPIEPISANAGDLFAIGMLSNPTTGYSWQMATPPDANVAQFVSNVYVEPSLPANGQPLLGAGGRECWIFSAIQAGSTTAVFNYLRPFDPPDTPPANTATFTIVVQ